LTVKGLSRSIGFEKFWKMPTFAQIKCHWSMFGFYHLMTQHFWYSSDFLPLKLIPTGKPTWGEKILTNML
jgi:hypothetical protein